MPNAPAFVAYQKLIVALKKELHEGMIRAEAALRRQKVITYWNIGRHIDRYLSGAIGANQSETVYLERIARDMDSSLDVMRKALKFFRLYPRLSQNPPLSWAQYRALLTAPKDQRKMLERRAFNENLGSERLYAIISSARSEQKKLVLDIENRALAENRLKQIRGRLYHYKTLQSKHLGLKKNEIMVDAGFSIRAKVSIAPGSSLSGGNVIRSVKTDDGYQLRYSDAQETELYTYIANIERVIDGDTLRVTVDCGFDIWIGVTVRLFGINAPEKTTISGYMAYQYAAECLGSAPFIVVKTYKTEKNI